MAPLDGKITFSTCEERPCWVDGRRAIFHRWTDSARPVKPTGKDEDSDERLQKWSVHGLVEYEDGRVEREWPSKIRFADSAEHFKQFDWETMEEKRDALPWKYDEPEQEAETEPPQVPADQPVRIIEKLSECKGCAYENVNEEYCPASDYNCTTCSVIGCPCKTCEEGTNREEHYGI